MFSGPRTVGKAKAIPVQARADLEGCRLPYAPAAFTTQEILLILISVKG
jgi:hypothetical protein